jgi:hypothetical protein
MLKIWLPLVDRFRTRFYEEVLRMGEEMGGICLLN